MEEIYNLLDIHQYFGCDEEYFEEVFEGNDKMIIDKLVERENFDMILAYLLSKIEEVQTEEE